MASSPVSIHSFDIDPIHPSTEKLLSLPLPVQSANGKGSAASQAPRLHALAGALQRIAVRYDLLVPAKLGLGFGEFFDRCADGRYHGINVTHPYKERAAAAGLDTVSCFELFFHQGADGFEIFFGGTVDRVRLRRAVGEPGRASAA